MRRGHCALRHAAAMGGDVVETQIVGHNQNDVRPLGGPCTCGCDCWRGPAHGLAWTVIHAQNVFDPQQHDTGAATDRPETDPQ